MCSSTTMNLIKGRKNFVINYFNNDLSFKRGFYCDDENLKHPYGPQSTVPTSTCLFIWVCLATLFITKVEVIRSYALASKQQRRSKPIKDNSTPWIAVELYRYFGFFALGAASTVLFGELAKYTIGRLRPHFLTVCGPQLTPQLCKDEFGYEKFVTEPEDVICENIKNGKYTKKELHEARLSFLSGHAAFSFYAGIFLIIYLQARLNNFPVIDNIFLNRFAKAFKILRPFIQFGLLILALWISLTRISDYYHHPLDVATGAIVGTVFAILTLTTIGNIFIKESSFWKTIIDED